MLHLDENLKDQIMNFRCIDLRPIESPLGDMKISLNSQSACHWIPSYFHDYIRFENTLKTPSKSNQNLVESNKWLKDFYIEEANIKRGKCTPQKGSTLVSLYKKIHPSKTKSVKTLLGLMENPLEYRN